jgi:hypothetical protein
MAQARRKGALVGVTLSHEEIETSNAAVAALAPVAPELAAVVGPVVGSLRIIDALGGNRGVEVVAVAGWAGCMSVPVGVPLFDVTSRLVDSVGNFITEKPWAAFPVLIGGGPVGWVAGGVGVLLGMFRKERERVIGPVVATRTKDEKGPWEKFGLVVLPDSEFAFSSRWGYLCAEDGGGGSVHANRPEIKEWEKWTIEPQSEGYVALKSHGNKDNHQRYYFVAEEGGESVCNANRKKVGEWEQFKLEFNDDGSVSLMTRKKDTLPLKSLFESTAQRGVSVSLGDAGRNRFPNVPDRPLQHLSAFTACGDNMLLDVTR